MNARVAKRVVNPTMIADAVYYAHPTSGASADNAKGVIIGMVSGLMACGLTYADAIGLVSKSLPHDYRDESLPAAWAHDIIMARMGM